MRRTVGQIEVGEPDTLLYLVQQPLDQGESRVFYELYASRQAFDEHERKPYVVRFLEERERYLARPPRVEAFTAGWGKGWPRETK